MKSGTTLTVEGIGKLILRSGSVIQIEENASLIIDAGAEMQFYGGAIIYMNGPTSKLILRSSIKIMDNGEFKIIHLGTSAGKVIIDSPAVGLLTATANSTAKYTFVGKGMTDPLIMLSPNAKLWAMDNLAQSLTIQNCKVEYGAGATIQSDQPFYSNSVTYNATATNGGVKTSETAIFNSSTLTNVPVFANMNIEYKGSFQAYNSTFTANSVSLNPNDQALVSVTGQGYNISGCTFSTVKNYGLKSTSLNVASIISGGTVQYLGTPPASYALTGIYDYSTVEVSVRNVTITKCNTGAEKRNGKLTLRCNTFTANKDWNVIAGVSCLLNMNSTMLGGYNQLFPTTNNQNIKLAQGNLDAGAGYNYIYLCPNGMTIYGATNSYCTTNCPAINVSQNQWSATNKLATGFANVVSLANSTYLFTTAPTAFLQTCPVTTLPGYPEEGQRSTAGGNDLPLVYSSLAQDSIPLDELIYTASGLMSFYNTDSTADNLAAADMLGAVFSGDLNKSDSTVNGWMWFGFGQMKMALEGAFTEGQVTPADNAGSFDPVVAKYAHALMVMSDSELNADNYGRQFYHEIDKAHLFRLLGHAEIGLNILTEVEACGLDSSEQAQLNYWKQQYERDIVVGEVGFAALDSVIVVDTTGYPDPASVTNAFIFGATISDLENIVYPGCSFQYRSEKRKSGNGLELFPNPATQEVTIQWNTRFVQGTGSLSICQPDGRTVFSKTVNMNEVLSLKLAVSDWKPGVYQVRFVQSDGVVFTAQLIVQ